MGSHDDAFGLREWQGTKQHAVNDRKNCSVGANPQSQRQHGNHCEAKRFTQYAETVADVLPESCHEVPAVAKYMSVSRERILEKMDAQPRCRVATCLIPLVWFSG